MNCEWDLGSMMSLAIQFKSGRFHKMENMKKGHKIGSGQVEPL